MSRKEEFKKELVNLLQQCVDEGLTVYFHKELTEEEKKNVVDTWYHRMWFFVTDGTTILYIGKNDFYTWSCSFEYVPTKDNGSGCCLLDRDDYTLTVDMIKKFLSIKTIPQLLYVNRNLNKNTLRLYKNADEWFNNHLWSKDKYEIIKK